MIIAKNLPEKYLVEYQSAHHTGYADTTPDKGGNSESFRPHDLLEAALATCLTMHLRMFAEKNEINHEGFQTTVSLDRTDPEKTVFKYGFAFSDKQNEEDRKKILAEAENSSVRKTLSKEISFALAD